MTETPKLRLHSFSSMKQFQESAASTDHATLRSAEYALIEGEAEFILDGYCYVCDSHSGFFVDLAYTGDADDDGVVVPNWRERLVCPHCNLNNRMRAVIHIMELLGRAEKTDRIYITEQMTYLFQKLQERYELLVGSEFLGEQFESGESNEQGIIHQDMTQLSFEDEAFDHILSFDVIEHIPDYAAALRECARCLRSGGCLLLSAPFRIDQSETLVRASIDDKGQVVHLLQPEYHGDPTDPDRGILCYYHFGWDILCKLKQAGFEESFVNLYWSREYGYLGGYQVVITAFKKISILRKMIRYFFVKKNKLAHLFSSYS